LHLGLGIKHTNLYFITDLDNATMLPNDVTETLEHFSLPKSGINWIVFVA
jgi:hypothetical protein